MKKAILALLAFFIPLPAKAVEYAIIPTDMWEQFRTGNFTWNDIINFLLHIIQFLLSIGGILAVILVMYGGFQYIFGAISEDKESGKTTITSALIGFVVILMAWIIVDIVISLVTSTGA